MWDGAAPAAVAAALPPPPDGCAAAPWPAAGAAVLVLSGVYKVPREGGIAPHDAVAALVHARGASAVGAAVVPYDPNSGPEPAWDGTRKAPMPVLYTYAPLLRLLMRAMRGLKVVVAIDNAAASAVRMAATLRTPGAARGMHACGADVRAIPDRGWFNVHIGATLVDLPLGRGDVAAMHAPSPYSAADAPAMHAALDAAAARATAPPLPRPTFIARPSVPPAGALFRGRVHFATRDVLPTCAALRAACGVRLFVLLDPAVTARVPGSVAVARAKAGWDHDAADAAMRRVVDVIDAAADARVLVVGTTMRQCAEFRALLRLYARPDDDLALAAPDALGVVLGAAPGVVAYLADARTYAAPIARGEKPAPPEQRWSHAAVAPPAGAVGAADGVGPRVAYFARGACLAAYIAAQIPGAVAWRVGAPFASGVVDETRVFRPAAEMPPGATDVVVHARGTLAVAAGAERWWEHNTA